MTMEVAWKHHDSLMDTLFEYKRRTMDTRIINCMELPRYSHGSTTRPPGKCLGIPWKHHANLMEEP